jgi:hypothetical protein
MPYGTAGYKLPDPKWDGPLRRCVKCGVEDASIYTGEADLDGSPLFVHRVVLDPHFCPKGLLSARDRAQGFLETKVEGTRTVKIRVICRECLEQDEQTSAVWRDFDKTRKELSEQTKEPSFYAVLCQE